MLIREASEGDIPEIIDVLRDSIGETKLPKTAEIWRYKHLKNPFGPSVVVVAIESGKIIGVRAFMKWQWTINDSKLSAMRAVDTGVIPGHQGKGVFRALNSAGLEIANARGENFIFNTPNSKSLPANLKMGWSKLDKLKITLLAGKLNFNRSDHTKLNSNIKKYHSTLYLNNLCENYNKLHSLRGRFFTPKSPAYLEWRYEKNPLQKYLIIAEEDFYLAAYVKNHKYFSELRIAEHIFFDSVGKEKIKKAIFQISQNFRTDLISYTSALSLSNFQVSGKIGPIMVLKPLNLDLKFQPKMDGLANWSYALGDLELF